MPQPQEVIGPEKVMTRFQAQRKLGLFAPHDYVMLALISTVWIVLGFWKLFGDPSAMPLIALAVVNIFLTQCWMIVLIYRTLVFILDVQADINLLPEAAARIVISFWEGRKR